MKLFRNKSSEPFPLPALGNPPSSPKKLINKKSALLSPSSSPNAKMTNSKSRWSSIRDKNNLNKIRIQKFNEELKNVDNFMKKNELIFQKYAQCKGNSNYLNLFGNPKSKPAASPGRNLFMPMIKKNIMAGKFAMLLKKQVDAHNINEKQIKFVKDMSYYKLTEFAKRRQKIQKQFSEFSNEEKQTAMNSFKLKILVCLNVCMEFLMKSKPFFAIKRVFKTIFKVKMPDGGFRISVDLISLAMIVYEILEIPLMLSFPESVDTNLENISNMITYYFLTEIFINFNTAVYKRGVIVRDRKHIAKHYVCSWFFIDAITSFPYEFLVDSLTNVDASNVNDFNSVQTSSRWIKIIRFIKFLKILRLLRVMKLKRIFSKIEEYLQLSPSVNAILAFIRLCFLIIGIAHWFACIWHLVAVYEEDIYPVTWLSNAHLVDADWTERYVSSIYWAITTMITVGYGDITPLTIPEKLYTIFCMLLACGVFGYTMNRIGSIFQSFEENSMEFKLKMFQINQYMRSKNVPKEMQARIRKYIQFTLDPEKRSQLDENSFFKCLSKNLKGEIILYINGNIINQSEIFSSLMSSQLLSKLPFFINEQIYGPEETIISEGDIQKDNNIYFLKQGAAKAFVKSTDTDIAEFSSGSTFGQVGFFSDLKWSFSVQSLDFISLFYLKRSDFLQVIEQEKLREDAEKFHEIKDRLNLYNDFAVIHVSCSCCHDENHQINTCPLLHHVINHEDLVKNSSQSEANFRQHFRRNTQRKKFNTKSDFVLIQSSVFALRDIILIIKEEGIKENLRIDIEIDDFFDENQDGLPVEKKINLLNSRNSSKNKSNDSFSVSNNEEDAMLSSVENLKRSAWSRKISYNREIDPIIESFLIDKIESFSHYFPPNNLEEITNFANKCAAQKLKAFSNQTNNNENPDTLKNMIKLTKSKTIKKRKDTTTGVSPEIKKKKSSLKEEKLEKEKEKEKEKDRKNKEKKEKLWGKPKIRFSIFGGLKKDPNEQQLSYKIEEKLGPEIKTTEIDIKAKSENKISNNLLFFQEIDSVENEPLKKEEEEAKEIQSLSPKSIGNKKGTVLDMKKKRKSTSCDGTYTLEDLLKQTNLKELEELVKVKKREEGNI